MPIFTNVVLNRSTMHRGPFRLPHIAGMTVNIVTVIWLVFAIVFFSFPFYMPVTGTSVFTYPFVRLLSLIYNIVSDGSYV